MVQNLLEHLLAGLYYFTNLSFNSDNLLHILIGTSFINTSVDSECFISIPKAFLIKNVKKVTCSRKREQTSFLLAVFKIWDKTFEHFEKSLSWTIFYEEKT